MEQFAWIVKFALCMFTFMTHFGEQTLAVRKLFLSLIRIDFAVAVSSRAVRISSRAVRVFPALSLRRVRPSYGTFSLMVFQEKLRAGPYGSYDKYMLFAGWEVCMVRDHSFSPYGPILSWRMTCLFFPAVNWFCSRLQMGLFTQLFH